MLNEIDILQLKKLRNNFINIINTKEDIKEILPSDVDSEMQKELDRIEMQYNEEIYKIKNQIDKILEKATFIEKMTYETIVYESSENNKEITPVLRKFEPKLSEILSNEEFLNNKDLLKSLNMLLSKTNSFLEKTDLNKSSFYNNIQFTLNASFNSNRLEISEIGLVRLDENKNVMTEIEIDIINGVVKYFDYECNIDEIEFLKDMEIDDILSTFKKMNKDTEIYLENNLEK